MEASLLWEGGDAVSEGRLLICRCSGIEDKNGRMAVSGRAAMVNAEVTESRSCFWPNKSKQKVRQKSFSDTVV